MNSLVNLENSLTGAKKNEYMAMFVIVFIFGESRKIYIREVRLLDEYGVFCVNALIFKTEELESEVNWEKPWSSRSGELRASNKKPKKS